MKMVKRKKVVSELEAGDVINIRNQLRKKKKKITIRAFQVGRKDAKTLVTAMESAMLVTVINKILKRNLDGISYKELKRKLRDTSRGLIAKDSQIIDALGRNGRYVEHTIKMKYVNNRWIAVGKIDPNAFIRFNERGLKYVANINIKPKGRTKLRSKKRKPIV